SPTISSSTPPVLAGCTKKYRCPPAPIRTASLASLTPCPVNRANTASIPSTCTATWCSPSPRLPKNPPIAQSPPLARIPSHHLPATSLGTPLPSTTSVSPPPLSAATPCIATLSCSTRSAPPRSLLFTTNTSATSITPAFRLCTSSPIPGTSTSTVTSASPI